MPNKKQLTVILSPEAKGQLDEVMRLVAGSRPKISKTDLIHMAIAALHGLDRDQLLEWSHDPRWRESPAGSADTIVQEAVEAGNRGDQKGKKSAGRSKSSGSGR